MNTVTIRCYAELNDLLPLGRRQVAFAHEFNGSPAVKDVLEAVGIPHTEVDLILANGGSVGFDYSVRDGDRLSVYPVFEAFDISGLQRVRVEALRETKFVLDVHLGRLARMLRLLGFDTAYASDAVDERLAEISRTERRILLTRDRGLLKRSEITHGYLVRSTEVDAQVLEVAVRFHLSGSARPFSRCLRCNGLLEDVDKAKIEHVLPPRVKAGMSAFKRCACCGRVYWRGTHYAAMQRVVSNVTGVASAPSS